MKVRLIDITPAAKDIYTFRFEPTFPSPHIAGQFIELYLPHKDKDSRGDKRWFTLSSSPSEDFLSITTKIIDDSSSFKKALKALNPGDELQMSSPMGDFVLPKDASIPLIFVAGGIGCTPFRSIIKYLQDNGQTRDITVIYNANASDDVAFREVFSKLGSNFIEITGERISSAKIMEYTANKPSSYIYISGPEPMIEALYKELKHAGISKKQLFTDYFPGYSEL